MAAPDSMIVRSREPMIDIPEVPLVDFAFATHNDFDKKQLEKPWIVNVPSGKQVTFGQARQSSRKIASALTRLGFKKGDILYFVTTESVDLYLVQLGVWILGGAVRGSSAFETQESYILQMSECQAKFVCFDSETEENVTKAAHHSGLSNKIFISVGDNPIKGSTHIKEMLADDETACPENVDIDCRNDVLLISNTSGSTGVPKGVMHTNYTYNANLIMMESLNFQNSMMEFAVNYGVVNVCLTMFALRNGITIYHLNKFDKEDFIKMLVTFKPSSIMLYPYIATWFARNPELSEVRKQDFLKLIMIGGWVLDPTTSVLLSQNLPNTHIQQVYGMSEILFATGTDVPQNGAIATIPTIIREGQIFTANGNILANMEAKVLDLETKEIKTPYDDGLVLIRSPSIMKGYLTPGQESNRAGIDSEGWLSTGDIGFFDQQGMLYVKERANFMFRYLSHLVAPSEIESVLQEHPAVLAAGVVGIPNPETNSLARAFLVLKPGQKSTSSEICAFAAGKLPYYKHLYGGTRFVFSLPANRGGKLDRKALKEMALADVNKTTL